MMNRTIIGLRIEYLLPTTVASVVGAVSMLLPYAGGMNLLGVLGGGLLPLLAVVFTVVTLALAVLNFVKPGVVTARVWVVSAAIQAVFMTILLFATKSMLNDMGIGGFLVKNFGIGYWLGLVTAYVTLVLAMKLTKINTGYIVLSILSVIWLFPISWIIITSLRAEGGYYVGYFIPKGFTIQNYINLFSNPSVLPFGRWYMNTLIVAVCSSLINSAIILSVAFVLSRTRFAGRTTFMKILLVIGMFPGFMSMLAVYNILKGLGFNQSLWALIVVGAAGAAMGYHICKGFFDTIPKALDEAATIDGTNRWQIFTKIIVPLSKPIAIYTLLTNFLGVWSDYIFPSILFGDQQQNYTVAVGLYWMTDFRRIDTYYTQFAAGAVVVAVPIVILFIALQRFYVEGLSGSVKG